MSMDKIVKKKVGTKMLKEMKAGEVRVLGGLTYKDVKSAQSISHQTMKSYGVETKVTYTEKVDGTYEVTVRRLA